MDKNIILGTTVEEEMSKFEELERITKRLASKGDKVLEEVLKTLIEYETKLDEELEKTMFDYETKLDCEISDVNSELPTDT